MPYTLKRTNGITLAIIPDGSIDAGTDLIWVGKNYAGYGQTVNENFLKLLENFSNTREPSKPLSGQLWYDSGNLKVKFYDGTRFKTFTTTEVATKKPSDLKAGDQWFDTIDQKLYVFNGAEFIMIGPEKTASALQSTFSASVIQNTNSEDKTVLQASVGTGPGTATAIFSKEAFLPNANGISYTDQKLLNVARGITLPGTSAVQGTADATVVGALPDKGNKWIFFGASGSSWGLLENDALGNIVFYDSKNYVRRSEFQNADFPITTTNNDGLLVNSVIKLHVTNNTVGNLSNINYPKIAFNTNPTGSGLVNVISLDYGIAKPADTIPTLQVLPNADRTVDLGSDGSRFRNGYIKNLYASSLNTTTTGVITGVWTLGPGSSIAGGSVSASSAASAGTAEQLRSYDNVNFVSASITETANSIAQRDSQGKITVSAINVSSTGTSKVIGTWILGATSTLQSTSILGDSTTGYVSPSQGTANNSIAQRTGTGQLAATAFITPKIIATGGLDTSPGTIQGAWTLVNNSTLEATYADIAERYEADSYYDAGTVLVVGGLKEVTLSSIHGDVRAAGIVSTNPAFKLNGSAGDDTTHPYIALKGRVPCKVVGWITKGNRLVTSQTPGYAESFREGDDPSAVIGISLENKETSGEGLVEVLVK
jgi:hypothetical protein